MRHRLLGLMVAVGCAWLLAGSESLAVGAPKVKNLSDLSCAAGQIPKFDGTDWTCAGDSVGTDTLGTLSCAAGQIAEFNGTNWGCVDLMPRLVDNGDTVTDNYTRLTWEKKTTCSGSSSADIHCVNNLYVWSTGGTSPNLFTDFLDQFDKALSTSDDGVNIFDVCFAGHCDWRLPNILELRSLLAPCGSGLCIDPIFGPTKAWFYWSSTTFASDQFDAWTVGFHGGEVTTADKTGPVAVAARAVRGR